MQLPPFKFTRADVEIIYSGEWRVRNNSYSFRSLTGEVNCIFPTETSIKEPSIKE